MSVDVSTLAIEVKSTGIKEASDALGGLSKTAGNLDIKVTSLTGKLENLMKGSGNLTGAANGLSSVMNLINSAMATATANAMAMAQAIQSATASLGNMTTANNQAASSLQEHSKRASIFTTTLQAMASAAIAYIGIGFAKHSIEAADAWQLMSARLKLTTGSVNNAKVAQEDLFNIAQKLRVPIEDTVTLFTRMAPIMRQNGQSFEQTKGAVEGLGLALKLNGATGQQAASVMLQFSEALNKGKLDGAHFNAVSQNSHLVMKALADYTHKTTGELAELRSKGFITPQLLMNSLNAALPEWRKQFESMPLTVGDAVTRIKNAWVKGMGELSADTGLNAGLAKSLGVIEGMIPAVRDELVKGFISVATWIDKNKDGISQVWGQVKALAKDIWNVVGLIADAAGGIFGLSKETNIFGLLIFTARVMLGGVVDIVKVVAQSFVLAGADVIDFFVQPIAMTLSLIGKIGEGVGWVIEKLAQAAKATGHNEIAAALTTGANAAKSFGDHAGDMAGKLATLTDGARTAAVSWTKDLDAGHGALQKVLDGEEDMTAEMTKQSKLTLDPNAWGKAGDWMKAPDKQALKDHIKAVKSATAEVNKLTDAYKELVAQSDHIDKFGLQWDKLTKSEKDVIVLTDMLGRTTDKEARGLLEHAKSIAEVNVGLERMNTAKINALEADKKVTENQHAQLDSAQKELDAINAKIEGFGKLKGSTDDAALAEAKRQMLMYADSADEAWVKSQQAVIDKLEEVGKAKEKFAGMQNSQAIDKWFDAQKVAAFGNGFADAFGKVGKSVDKAGKALDSFQKKMHSNNEERKAIELEKNNDSSKYATDIEKLNKKQLGDELTMYGDMAGAMKDFFGQKTAAYKVFDLFEQGMRVARLAQDAEEFATKIAQGWAWISEKVAQGVAAMANDTIVAGVSQKNSEESAGASLIAGVAKCFEQMGVWGFIGAGAIIAFMAAMGIHHGGGGGSSGGDFMSAADRQKQQGTGTVLGDEGGKSDSIAKSLDLLVNKSNIALDHSSRMLVYLRDINDGIGSMAGQTAAMSGVRGTTADQFAAGVGSTKGAFGFSGTSTTMTDSGLKFDPSQTVASMMMGNVGVSGYEDINKQSSSWWGLSKSTSNQEILSSVNQQFAAQVQGTVKNMVNLTNESAKALGVTDANLTNTISQMKLGIDKISLMGLSGNDLTNAINSVFSKLGDQMAQAVGTYIGGPGLLAQFQQVGEGQLQTLVRLANGYENAKMLLDQLGVSIVNLGDVVNKQGDVGAELVRQSLESKEAGSNIAGLIDEVNGTAEDIISAYTKLRDIRGSLRFSGLAFDVTQAMIAGAGSLDNLTSSLGDFLKNFYTAGEQAGIGMKKINEQFASLGLTMPSTKDAFKSLVEQLMAGDSASQQLATTVMGMSGAFSDAMAAVDSAVSDAKSALKDAYDNESQALQATIDKMKGFVTSLQDFKKSLTMGDLSPLSEADKYAQAKQSYEGTLKLAQGGDSDAIGKLQDVANTFLTESRSVYASGNQYTQDYQNVIAALDQVTGVAQASADSTQNQLDLLTQQVSALIDINTSVKTVAQAIVDLQNALAQASGGTVQAATAPATGAMSNTTTSAIVGAIASAYVTGAPTGTGPSLTGALLSVASAVDGSHADGLAQVPFDGYRAELHKGERVLTAAEAQAYNRNDPLVAEVQALRAEVTALRQDQREQTNAFVTATYDANERNADSINKGQKDAAQEHAYANRTQPKLN